jgi:uncharacterized protein YndB with AHSA1/START domain
MNRNLIAKAETDISAPVARVWDALVTPEAIEKYMFGTHVASSWQKGSPITWTGEWQGKKYEDKGEIIDIEPNERLRYSHFSPLAGLPDEPENYHHVTIELDDRGPTTHVTLVQDNNSDEKARRHSEENWRMMLDGLKRFVEDPKG